MGSWGIAMRESDYGLDLLGTIVDTRLKTVDFRTFHVADALELFKAGIIEEIRRTNRGCSAADFVSCFSDNFLRNFTQGALLVAECLDDYYRTGELVVYDYVGENYDPVEHHIKDFVVTEADLKLLLDELQSVQNPEHWLPRDDGFFGHALCLQALQSSGPLLLRWRHGRSRPCEKSVSSGMRPGDRDSDKTGTGASLTAERQADCHADPQKISRGGGKALPKSAAVQRKRGAGSGIRQTGKSPDRRAG